MVNFILLPLRRFPNAAFGIVLGLGGQSMMWKTVLSFVLGPHQAIARGLNYLFWAACLVVYLSFLCLYTLKLRRHFDICKAEWEDPVRSNFFFAPGIGLIMLALGAPVDLFGDMGNLEQPWAAANTKAKAAFMGMQQSGFFIGFLFQATLVQMFYVRWTGDTRRCLSTATAPFLLTTINWFLLALLGVKAEVAVLVGINLPPMLFGIGCFFAGIIYANIFQQVHESTAIGRGHPAMFLTLAPLSVASMARAEIRGGEFDDLSCGLLGLALLVFVLLMRSWPNLLKKPAFLGIYWAYVFPLCALANACIAHANTMKSSGARLLAWFFVFVACIGFIMVVARTTMHCVQVARGKEIWGEPLLKIVAEKQALADKEAAAERRPEPPGGSTPKSERTGGAACGIILRLKDLVDEGECCGADFNQTPGFSGPVQRLTTPSDMPPSAAVCPESIQLQDDSGDLQKELEGRGRGDGRWYGRLCGIPVVCS